MLVYYITSEIQNKSVEIEEIDVQERSWSSFTFLSKLIMK